jgi:hypothetical protein
MKNVYVIIAIAGVLVGGIGCAGDSNDDESGGTSVAPPMQGGVSGVGGAGAGVGVGNAGATSIATGGTTGGMPPMPTGGMNAAGAPATGGMSAAGDAGASGAMAMAGAGGATTEPTPHMGETCLLPGNGMYTEEGPYQVGMMDVDLGMIEDSQHTGMFTIFYPMPLEASCLHPIVVWGNGTTVMGSGTYAFFNINAASWGMVVAASHEDNTGSGNHHKAGIDYLLAQNEDASSMFYHKLSTRVGVSGHSQGGFGASKAFSHPNVETAVIVGATARASDKVSVIILTGTEDIAAGATTAGAAGPMFVASWEGGDHVGTETIAGYIGRDPGTLQMQRFYAAWFRCFLADDATACDMFFGGAPTGCGVCSDTGWASLMSANMM